MSQRDELANLIGLVTNRFNNEVTDPWLWSLTDAIRAAGYRKPRTIETVEELNALPEDSIILDQGVTATLVDGAWCYDTGMFEPDLPATVLYVPGEL